MSTDDCDDTYAYESVDDYARNQGCFRDHTKEPFRFQDHVRYFQKTLYPVQSDGFVHQSGLGVTSLEHTPIEPEILETNDDLIAELCGSSPDLISSKAMGRPRFNSTHDLRISAESLLLDIDPDEYYQRYLSEVASKRNCNMSEQWLPLASADAEKNESLVFPRTASRWRALLLRELECECIRTNRVARALEKEAPGLPWTIEDESSLRQNLMLPKVCCSHGLRHVSLV